MSDLSLFVTSALRLKTLPLMSGLCEPGAEGAS